MFIITPPDGQQFNLDNAKDRAILDAQWLAYLREHGPIIPTQIRPDGLSQTDSEKEEND